MLGMFHLFIILTSSKSLQHIVTQMNDYQDANWFHTYICFWILSIYLDYASIICHIHCLLKYLILTLAIWVHFFLCLYLDSWSLFSPFYFINYYAVKILFKYFLFKWISYIWKRLEITHKDDGRKVITITFENIRITKF